MGAMDKLRAVLEAPGKAIERKRALEDFDPEEHMRSLEELKLDPSLELMAERMARNCADTMAGAGRGGVRYDELPSREKAAWTEAAKAGVRSLLECGWDLRMDGAKPEMRTMSVRGPEGTYTTADTSQVHDATFLAMSRAADVMSFGVHDALAAAKRADGWTYGPEEIPDLKKSPAAGPIELLPDAERDRRVEESRCMVEALTASGVELITPQAAKNIGYGPVARLAGRLEAQGSTASWERPGPEMGA